MDALVAVILEAAARDEEDALEGRFSKAARKLRGQ
jgi:hypothetical protein